MVHVDICLASVFIPGLRLEEPQHILPGAGSHRKLPPQEMGEGTAMHRVLQTRIVTQVIVDRF